MEVGNETISQALAKSTATTAAITILVQKACLTLPVPLLIGLAMGTKFEQTKNQ